MRLPTRLLLLVCLALIPVIGIALYTQAELREARRSDLADRAGQQAELWNGTLGQLVEATHDVALAAIHLPALRGATQSCGGPLADIRSGLPRYRFFALLDANGRLLCSTGQDVEDETGSSAAWLSEQPDGSDFWMGDYTHVTGTAGFLPFLLRYEAEGGSSRVLVAALDLQRLSDELNQLLSCCGGLSGREATMMMTDRHGVVLYRFPDPERWIGRTIGPSALPLVNAAAAGTTMITGLDGKRRVFGYVPATQRPFGLFVGSGFFVGDATADIDAAMWRGGFLLTAGTALALVFAWFLGQRWIARPARLLLQTAGRWREGDLAARVPVAGMQSELGQLAATFNDLAADLKRREEEQLLHALLLEERVEERTSALSETNNRLQVEIADRERTEVALHRAQKLQAVGQLAGGVAHEFNNMLATVLGNLELLERRLPAGDPRLKPWIERAIAAVQRGGQLTSRLLAFSRRQRLATGPIDVNALASDLATLAGSAPGRRVDVVTSFASDLWLAMADRSQLEASILNLAFNARDAMPDGGILTLSTANETVAAGNREDVEPGHYVRVSVADTGTGMRPEVLARAIEPFFTTKGPGGSGLGLSQAYGMARQSGGTLRIVSDQGLGTTVSLLLPSAAWQAHGDGMPAEPESGDLSGLSVLIVDDDTEVRQATAAMLTDLGCEVIDVSGGAEALVVLGNTRVGCDVVVADYAMPQMNGLELTSAIRARGWALPVILATGYAEFPDPGGSEMMLSAVLRKPFTLHQLRETILLVCSRPAEGLTEAAAPGQPADIGFE
jgi:signal transduction histidine kinase/CheY-like chemotaxis protein